MSVPMEHILHVTLQFVAFAFMHSLLAIPSIKLKITTRLHWTPAGYRLVYNVLSFLMLGMIVLVEPPLSQTFYTVAAPYRYILHLVQAGAALVFLLAMRDFDMRRFLGLSDPEGEAVFNTGGLFRYCRHPMYSAAMLFLFANPDMTVGWLVYAGNISLYFVIGSIFEERHLEQRFGAAYKAYKRTVPKFLPRVNFSRLRAR